MKKYVWDPNKFRKNILEPAVGMLVFIGLGVVWF